MTNRPKTTADLPKQYHTGHMHGNRPKGQRMSKDEREERKRIAASMARTFNNQNSKKESINNYMSYNDALLKSRMELASRVLSHMCDADLHEATMALVEKMTKGQKFATGAVAAGLLGGGAGYGLSKMMGGKPPQAPAAVSQPADTVKDKSGNAVTDRFGKPVRRAKNRADAPDIGKQAAKNVATQMVQGNAANKTSTARRSFSDDTDRFVRTSSGRPAMSKSGPVRRAR